MENEDVEQKIDRLVFECQQGRAESFGKLYDLFISQIYRYVYYRVNREDVEDLTELIFLKVWENICKYRKTEVPFRAWVFRIAHNLLVDHYRVHRSLLKLDHHIKDTRQESDPVHLTEASLNNEILIAALGRLKKNYRDILIFKFINDFDNSEIARILGRREGSIRVLQFRALNALRKELEGMGMHL